jgi:cytochrome c-type biogenesis protein CcmE
MKIKNSILLIIVIFICGFILLSFLNWKKEVKYRLMMENLIPKMEKAWVNLHYNIENLENQRFMEYCNTNQTKFEEIVGSLNMLEVPKKYRDSHKYKVEGIVNLDKCNQDLCRMSKDRNYTYQEEDIQKSIDICFKGIDDLITSTKILESESKNKSLFEKIYTE